MRKNKIVTWSFGIILIMNLYYFYVIDHYNTRLFGISMQDVALAAAMLWGVYYWIKLIKLPNPKFYFGRWMLAMLIMVLLSSIQSNRLCGQSLIGGIAPQRWIWVWALVYFPVRKCIYNKIINLDDFIAMLLAVGICQLILWTVQFFLGDSVFLTHVGRGTRSNRTRYYYNPVLLDFLFLLSLDRFVKYPRMKKVLYVVIAGLVLFETMVIQQFRATTMGLLVCMFFFAVIHVLFMKGNNKYKIICFMIGCIVVGGILSTSLMRSALKLIFENRPDIRSVGRELYLRTLFEHPILGGGYPNTHYEPAMTAATDGNSAIYMSDNGIFGFFYLYGGIGIIWIVTLWYKLLLNGMKIKRFFSELAYLLFPLFFIVVSRNELHWYWEYGFIIFSIFLCIEESKLDEIYLMKVTEGAKGSTDDGEKIT